MSAEISVGEGVDMVADPALFVLGSFVVACSATVDRLPRAGESLQAQAFLVEPGGKGLNLAVGARRLGASVDGLLAIGDDPLAALAAPALDRAGLPAAMLHRFPGPTGAGIGFTDAAGENCLAVHPGANARLGAAEVRAAAERIARSGLVLAQFEIGDDAVAEAFRIARAAGLRTLLNPSPFRMPEPDILARTAILVVNAVEAAAFGAALGMPVPEGGPDEMEAEAWGGLAAAILARGPDLVVVTLGAGGALAFRPAVPPWPSRPSRCGWSIPSGPATPSRRGSRSVSPRAARSPRACAWPPPAAPASSAARACSRPCRIAPPWRP